MSLEAARPRLTVLEGGKRSKPLRVRQVVGLDIRHLFFGEPPIEQPMQPSKTRPRRRLTVVPDVYTENH